MASKRLTVLLLTVGLMLQGCTLDGISPSPSTPSSSALTVETQPTGNEFTEPGFNLLVEIEGEVLLKRAAWSDFHPTAFGAALGRGDLLQLPRGAKATVLCDSLTVWQVPAGVPANLTNGCPQSQDAILVRGRGGVAGTQRGTPDPLIPYTISPRATKLLNDKPVLRWNDSGADSYTVQVRGGDLRWRREGVTRSELVYPGEPALEPGAFYLLVVEDSNGKSSQDEGLKGLGFSVLDEAEVERLRADAALVEGLSFSSEAEAFAVAQLYAGSGLVAEAVEILEGLVEEGSEQAAVHQALAEFYVSIGLSPLAESRYLEAIQLAEAEGNIEAQAAIQAGLGEVYGRLYYADEAIRWLTRAQAAYEILGDSQRVSELALLLADLNQ